MMRVLLAFLALLAAPPAAAQDFPKLTGRVVDAANILPPADEASLAQKLEAVETASSRQLVVATVPSLQGNDVADYGYQLGRHWGIGQKGANNGIILLVAPNERRVTIQVGYGLEPIMTDALSHQIISQQILPRFKADDYPGGIHAGADAIIAQLQAPPEQAEQKALAAQQARQERAGSGDGGGSIFPLIFWGVVFLFFILPMLRGGRRGRRHRRGSGVWVWGGDLGGGGWGGGSGGGSFGGFDGGGFSGGGGSFGGGGASGGW